jgi:predicted transcriptional regulator
MKQLWSEADDATLLQMSAAGRTSAQIADALGRTKDAVDTRKRILRGTRKRRGQPKPAVPQSHRVAALVATIERVKQERRVDGALLYQYRMGLLQLVRQGRQ